jgi:diaminopimelate decarboxylase
VSAARGGQGGPRLFAFGDDELRDLAERHGTPCFAYRAAAAGAALHSLRAVLPPRVRVAFAVKANPHPALLAHLARRGASFDCASAGELAAAAAALAAAGAPPAPGPGGSVASRLLFAGPGKQDHELALAVALGARVQAEGPEDLLRLQGLARGGGGPLRVNLRVHPAQGVQEERPILGGAGPSAFGVDEEQLAGVLDGAATLPQVRITGLHVFAASNERDAARLLSTHAMVLRLARRLEQSLGAPLEQVDLGGGLGVPYAPDEAPLDLAAFGRGLQALLAEHAWFRGELLLEPGRFLAAGCGVYLARVVRTKLSRGVRFAVLQGGLNHLARPLLTGQAFPVRLVGRPVRDTLPTVLAGPLCTSLDRLGEVPLPPDLAPGDLLAFGMAGAYGATEALTRFLGHPPAPEVWVEEPPGPPPATP